MTTTKPPLSVLRRTEGRRVGEFEVRELWSGQARANGRGEHVDALVDPLGPHTLGAQNLTGDRIDQQFERHLLRPGVVARVAHRVRVDGLVGEATRDESLLIPPCGGDGQVEDLDDGGANRGERSHVAPGIVVRDDAALVVGDVRERHQRGRAVEALVFSAASPTA